jgi:hypothetical protein
MAPFYNRDCNVTVKCESLSVSHTIIGTSKSMGQIGTLLIGRSNS